MMRRLLILTIGITLAAAFFVARRTSGTRLYAVLPGTDAIAEGAPVTYLGLEIGTVERLHVDRRPAVAELRIKREDALLRRGDYVRIQSRGLLGADALEIVQGTQPAAALREGDTLHFVRAAVDTVRLHAKPRSIGHSAVDRVGPDEIVAALRGVAPTARGVVFPGSRDDRAQYVFNRRSTQSDVEQHEAWDDILIVKSGRGIVRHGGTWQSPKPIYQGERRGGSLVDPQEVPVGPGDVIRIPAGEPHRIVPDGDSPLTYLVVKVQVQR